MLTFNLFVRPALWKLGGRRELFPPQFHAVATERMRKRAGRREFKRGILTYTGERWEVCTTGPQGSGILSSMAQANCFIVIEEERGDIEAGRAGVGGAVPVTPRTEASRRPSLAPSGERPV